MPRISEIKDQQTVVTSVGSFANSLQQIAAMRMVKLRRIVVSSRRFVDEATLILRELNLERTKQLQKEMSKNKTLKKIKPVSEATDASSRRKAVIVITSDIGLCGSYNTEIINKIDQVVPQHLDADFYVIGHKGQNYFDRIEHKFSLKWYPYNIPEAVSITDLKPLVGMFYYYGQVFLLYSRFINTTTREVVFMELAIPNVEEIEVEKAKTEGKYIFEPSLEELITSVSARIRQALFRQQILDSKLSLYTAQMIAMKTASDNAQELLTELQLEYNKARRKQVDRKILEVQAGRSLWTNQEV